MRKAVVLVCVVGDLVGGLVAFELAQLAPGSAQSAAQEPSPWGQRGQDGPVASRPVGPAAATPGGPSQANSLTAEEQVNVFVYQQVNRSVVNINTKGSRAICSCHVRVARRRERQRDRPPGPRADQFPRG